jgi:hypothetical protein
MPQKVYANARIDSLKKCCSQESSIININMD